MKPETKYSYQKRIKELEDRIRILENRNYLYHATAMEIFDGVLEVMKSGSSLSNSWVLGRFKKCFR